jgi:hypothetical protein
MTSMPLTASARPRILFQSSIQAGFYERLTAREGQQAQ